MIIASIILIVLSIPQDSIPMNFYTITGIICALTASIISAGSLSTVKIISKKSGKKYANCTSLTLENFDKKKQKG